jgi:hypothetical protein
VLAMSVWLLFGIFFSILTLRIQSLAYQRWKIEGYLLIQYKEWCKEIRRRETGPNTFSAFEKIWLEYDVLGCLLRTLALGSITMAGISFAQLPGSNNYLPHIVLFGLFSIISIIATIHQSIRLYTIKVI